MQTPEPLLSFPLQLQEQEHYTFPGVPWNTNLFDRREHTRLVSWTIKQSNRPSLHVSILPNLPGQTMSNENGDWANLFCCIIWSIIPFIDGPGVINKQNSTAGNAVQVYHDEGWRVTALMIERVAVTAMQWQLQLLIMLKVWWVRMQEEG